MAPSPTAGAPQDAPAREALLLSQMTWPETRDRLSAIELILIPVGAHEQHGPGLGMGTDTVSAVALCEAAAARLGPRVAVAPAIPWGVSWHHMAFAGTITLRHETLGALLEDVIGSLLAHGFGRFLVVNAHGGNAATIATALERVKQTRAVPLVASIYGYALLAEQARALLPPAALGHGGADEASVVLAVAPRLAHPSRFASPDLTGSQSETAAVLRAFGGSLARGYDQVTRDGPTGDPSAATAALGRRILDGASARLAEIVEMILRDESPPVPPPDLPENGGPVAEARASGWPPATP